MDLQPLKTFRASSNAASLLRHEGRTFLVKRYVGENAPARRACEAHALKEWQDAGFKVPQVLPLEIPDLADSPYLVMAYLEGPTLQEYLQDPARLLADKLALLVRIFESNCRRQVLARERRQPLLLHPDPNSSNVILAAGDFYFIDFETPVAGADLEEAAAIETAKFCRWTARDLGRPELPQVAAGLVEAYREHLELLRPIVSRTRGRPFQFFHRWQDARKKRRQPREVTKYDVADALNEALGEVPRRASG